MFHLFSLSQPLAIGGARSSPFLPLSLELSPVLKVLSSSLHGFSWTELLPQRLQLGGAAERLLSPTHPTAGRLLCGTTPLESEG